ncbi:class I SAM-dependent methyltransferase [Eisenibacter elegans]|uniref:class I SAM-dependent methyltransferase n=1 Tax=Eisenibacter elegans TaxID=997 RepID=UPI0003FF7673|nr:class I SAM-dependent methyltransferase [Eisenibacter elegans]
MGFFNRFLRLSPLGAAFHLYYKSGLQEDGWFRSYCRKQPIDAQGNPLPWYSYAAIRFLEPRLSPDFRVLEYGAGNSTLWYAQRVRSVLAIEHDSAWVKALTPLLPDNAKILHKPLEPKEAYTQAAENPSQPFELIIIDGRLRNRCVAAALQWLSDDGVLILDNAERAHYAKARRLLQEKGFKYLEFWGMPVGVPVNSSTHIYYRPNNVLGI